MQTTGFPMQRTDPKRWEALKRDLGIDPSKARKGDRVIISDSRAIFKDAESHAKFLGGRLATLEELAMNVEFLDRARRPGEWVFVDWRGAPNAEGWHRVDRSEGILEPISEAEAGKLEWHEKLLVHHDALDAIKERRPLAVIGDGDVLNGARQPCVRGNYAEDYSSRIAYVKE